MYSLKQAKQYATNMDTIHNDGDKWLVFKTPIAAPCNQYPGNVHNTGRYHVCRSSERTDYEAGGAQFI